MATVGVEAFDVTSAHYSQIFHGKLFTGAKNPAFSTGDLAEQY